MRAAALGLLALACGGGGEDSGTAGKGSGGAPLDTGAAGDCAGVPIVNYDNFGQAWLLHTCQGCHASTAPNRYGAPVESTFDTVEQVWAQRERVLARAGAEPPTMPPAGGSSADDRVRLRWWLQCQPEGT